MDSIRWLADSEWFGTTVAYVVAVILSFHLVVTLGSSWRGGISKRR